jgi:hypothetical protein
MSESDIVSLIEQYINRPFEEKDLASLRVFLRNLQAPKTSNVVKSTPIPKTSTTSGVPSYVKEKSEVDTSALREERLAEVQQATGVKARLGVWQEKVQQAEDGTPDNSQIVAERVAEAKAGAGVKGKLGLWNKKVETEESSVVTTDEQAKAERLAELKSVGSVKDRYQVKDSEEVVKSKPAEDLSAVKGSLKDRLGAYQQVAEKQSAPDGSKHVADEEIKGVSGVKDRLGAYTNTVESSGTNTSATEERLAEIKGVTGVKDRLGAYTNTVESSDATVSKANDSQQLDAIRKTSSVQKGKETWNKVQDKDSGISNSKVVEERTAEAKVGGSLKDRLNVWTEKQNEPQEQAVRKEPIKIDYGF